MTSFHMHIYASILVLNFDFRVEFKIFHCIFVNYLSIKLQVDSSPINHV